MPSGPDTGHGATLTFGTSAYAFNWTSIDSGEKSRPPIETTHLGTTGERTFMPGDLDDAGELTVPFQWDNTLDEITTTTTAETITVTYPGGATLAGTGLITRVKRPNLQTGEVSMGEITVKWDGGTGPTFTKEV